MKEWQCSKHLCVTSFIKTAASIFPSTMITPTEATASTISPHHDVHIPSEENSSALITPEPAAAAAKFQSTRLAADAPSTNPKVAPVEAAPPSLLSNTNMTMSQDYDVPVLPERSSPPIRELTPTVTVNAIPEANNTDHHEDPQLASLQAIFPDFDSAVLYVFNQLFAHFWDQIDLGSVNLFWNLLKGIRIAQLICSWA